MEKLPYKLESMTAGSDFLPFLLNDVPSGKSAHLFTLSVFNFLLIRVYPRRRADRGRREKNRA